MKTLVMNLREQLHRSLVCQEPICAWSMLVRPLEILSISMLEELRLIFMPYHKILSYFIWRILYLYRYSVSILPFRSRNVHIT